MGNYMSDLVMGQFSAKLGASRSQRFRPYHPADQNFFLSLIALIWLGLIMGFGPQVIQEFEAGKTDYPVILHIHALTYTGWMVLLTAQALFVRNKQVALHRRLGVAGAAMAALMVPLGIITAITMHQLALGTPASRPHFIAIQLGEMTAFGAIITAALYLRANGPAHKRLIILATAFISDAGFARWLGGPIREALGPGFVPGYLASYAGPLAVVMLIGLYDLLTRRRLHPAFVLAAAWGLTVDLAAKWLFVSPWWKPVALAIIGG
jgi:hypothetical protein